MEKQNEVVKELTITRLINAPRQKVWKAWTDPKLVAQWWGPRNFSIPLCEIDLRPGGRIVIHMSGYGMLAPMAGVFKEIKEPERLVFTSNAYTDATLSKVLLEGLTTVTLADEGGKTRVTVHSAILKAAPEATQALAGMDQGWTEQIEKLEEFLK